MNASKFVCFFSVSEPTYTTLQPVLPMLNDVHDAANEDSIPLNVDGSLVASGENHCDPVCKPPASAVSVVSFSRIGSLLVKYCRLCKTNLHGKNDRN